MRNDAAPGTGCSTQTPLAGEDGGLIMKLFTTGSLVSKKGPYKKGLTSRLRGERTGNAQAPLTNTKTAAFQARVHCTFLLKERT